MGNFTYEFENKNVPLEDIEWDNVWWEDTNSLNVPKVLYVGDSISCATRHIATKTTNNSIVFDGFGTSKAVDNPYFLETLRLVATQQQNRKIILFNNGLHGWHLEDSSQYIDGYEKIVKFMLEEFADTPIILLLTTAVTDNARNARVIERNNAVLSLAKKYNLPVIDLYSIVNENRDLISEDGVHLITKGYELLAKEIVSVVKAYLK